MRFQGPTPGPPASLSRRQEDDDGYSNNKRSNGSNMPVHPLKSAILMSRASSRSEVRHWHLRGPDSQRREARDVTVTSPASRISVTDPQLKSSQCPIQWIHQLHRSDKAASPCRSRFVWSKGEVHSKLGVPS